MNTSKKGLILLLVAMIFSVGAFSQGKSVAAKADYLFDQNRFIEALEQYTKAYDKIKDNKAEKNRIYFQMAECYRLMYDYVHAERIYRRLASDGYSSREPKLYFNLAEMCRFNEKFTDAEEFYDKYLKENPTDSYAKKRKQSLIMVTQMANNRTRHEISKMDAWCTDYNDWAPRFLGTDTSKIVFTTSRFGEGEEEGHDAWTGQAFSSLYYVYQDRNKQWVSTPEPWDKSGKINTTVNEGEACFSPDGNTIYFSRCDVRPNETLGCSVYMSTRTPENVGKKKKKVTKAPAKNSKGNANSKNAKNNTKTADEPAPGEWSVPVRINLGDTAYNFLYPAISSDGLTLYFSSDLPGGYGGYDLWKVTRNSTADNFGRPVNLTSIINTAGNEVFPVLRTDSLLYFSSNGHPGVGGQDLFQATLRTNGKWTTPLNLGMPINSSYDEMSIVFYPEDPKSKFTERGYFSSNRPFADPQSKNTDRKGKQTPPINDDIFYFQLPALNYSIAGTVRDEKSMQLIAGARIKLVGSDGTEAETSTDKKGYYHFDNNTIRREVVYKMYVSKKDYYSIEGSESTLGYNSDKDLVHDFRMEPIPSQPIVLPQIEFDLGRDELKSQFMDSLMDLYLVMVNHPSVVVEIRSHTDCQPYIGLTNDTLSQRRAQTVVDYLVSRGIERDRLVAKGYGDRIPRVLTERTTVDYNGKKYVFSAGEVMDCDYIATIKGDRQQAAHSLNRRIEFLVLRTDYVSKRLVENMNTANPTVKQTEDGKIVDLVNEEPQDTNVPVKPMIVHDESTIPVTMVNSTSGEITCIINGSQVPMLINERYKEPIAISWEEAMNFLYQRRLTKEDFPMRDNAFDPEGNILDKATVILKHMQIGEQRLENVEVVVVKGINYKFIINRQGLSKFGDYDFDKQRSKLIFFDE